MLIIIYPHSAMYRVQCRLLALATFRGKYPASTVFYSSVSSPSTVETSMVRTKTIKPMTTIHP